MRKLIFLLCFVFLAFYTNAQTDPLWLRYPAISPDGNFVAFSYRGDIYKVSSKGGTAVPLTIHPAYDFRPVWSRDGKWIAFASDRYGNFDVYIVSANGGEPLRLTYNSANDLPVDFSPDGAKVIFTTNRHDQAQSARFPVDGVFQKLYEVSVKGGRSIMINEAGTNYAKYSPDGSQIIFEDIKGFEDAWRKHHTSSIARDIWLYQTKTNTYSKLTTFDGEDREPVFSRDGKNFYWLNEESGSFNVAVKPVNGGAEKQLTHFKTNPVRHLSISNNNTICFTYDGSIYTMADGGQPQKLKLDILTENNNTNSEVQNVTSGGDMQLSPDGKQVAFVFRGEIFVTSVEGHFTKRITNTPFQERSVSFSKDGRTLYYAAEHEGSGWDIMKTSIERKEEPYFFNATVLKTEKVIQTDLDEFQPDVSPDGKKIAYLEERNTLKVYDLGTGKTTTIVPKGQNFSYADGDQNFTWSPDSKYLAVEDSRGYYGADGVTVFDVNNPGNGTDVVNSGFSAGNMQWGLGGKALLFANSKYGKLPLAVQGAREVDIFATFFDKDAYDQFKLSKDEFDLLKNEKDTSKGKGKDSSLNKKTNEPLKMDFSDLDSRVVRITPGSINLSSYALSQKGDKLFVLAKFEKGYDLWEIDPRTKEMKSIAKLGAGFASMQQSNDGKFLLVQANGKLSKVDESTGKLTPIDINSEMIVNGAAERDYIFHHAWRQVSKKLYDPNLRGIDWKGYEKIYEKFLPYINNNYDFRELLSEILGELNVSHTGGRYRPQFKNPDETAALGLLFDDSKGGNGLLIQEVIAGGPLDRADSKIRAGQTITAIDGNAITADVDWAKFLNRKKGLNVLLTLRDASGKTFDEVVQPISSGEENALLYKRWTKKMEDMVNKLSGGKVGYVHVQAMNDASYRNVYDAVLGKNKNKEALIVDTRFNGGGWLHEDLSTFLSGKLWAKFVPYGVQPIGGGEPANKWDKPSCVLMNEANYSDAHVFPYAYRAKGLGKLIGMPVQGTGTAVWWETQIDPTMVFGIPMIAMVTTKENRTLEGMQLEPDIKVPDEYNKILEGEDQQIEAAVKEMLKEAGK